MTERCHCGAERIAELAFCVMCGARRPAPALVGVGAHGATPRPAPRPTPGPVRYAAPLHPSLPPVPAPFPMALAYEPQPAGRSSAPWIVGAAAIVVLAVVGALLVLTLRPAASAASPTTPQTVLVPSTTTVTAAPSPSSGGSTSSGSSTTSLDDQVANDRASVESLVGSWVPQLSSKSVGTVADGITYDAGDILGHYQGLAASYPGAKLLYSGDWPVFRNGDYWVIVVAQPFSTASGANAWCSAQNFGPDDCFAKKLSHSGGTSGSTVQR